MKSVALAYTPTPVKRRTHLRRPLAGKPTVYCQECDEKCYRLQYQVAHWAGIKKKFRGVPEEKRPEGAREAPRYGTPDYVHCPKCGRPRDAKGFPLEPEKLRPPRAPKKK